MKPTDFEDFLFCISFTLSVSLFRFLFHIYPHVTRDVLNLTITICTWYSVFGSLTFSFIHFFSSSMQITAVCSNKFGYFIQIFKHIEQFCFNGALFALIESYYFFLSAKKQRKKIMHCLILKMF